MMIFNLLKFGLSIALPALAFTSTIPQYPIAFVDSKTVQFADQEVFSVDGIYWEMIPEWNPGDLVTVTLLDANFVIATVKSGDYWVHTPMFTLINNTQGTKVKGYLISPSQVNVITIASINQTLGIITLSDATVWNIDPFDQRFLSVWSVGDQILVGKNTAADQQEYDAVLFNTDYLTVVHAIQ